MGDLERTGIELVVENQSGFSAAMQSATNSVQGFTRAGSEASGGAEGLTQKSATLAVAVGSVLASAFESAVQAGMQVANMAIQNVKNLQDLEITLSSLVGAEAVQAGMADNVSQAMDMVGGRVDVLFSKIKEISLASPFEYQQIVSVMQMNMAFGQTSDTALALTKAVTDLASVNKGIPNILSRITYNFSQMNMVGKISMRDMRDLAMAGVDLGKVLKQGLGMSIEEVNKALASGKLTMQDVTNAFVQYVDVNFGGAAKRASRSLGGLVSSFKDLTFFASADVFKPAIDRITGALADLFDKASAFIDSGALKTIGYTLDWVVEKAIGFATSMVSSAQEFGDGWGGKIKEIASSAFDWGINIIAQLAGGIAQAAATVLVSAMNIVGQVLSWFLAPGSPPNIAPDIDTWGAQAMGEYLQGFTEADYSILDSIQGPLKAALSDPKMFGMLSRQIIGLLSTNTGVSDELFNQISSEASPAVAELVRMQVDLANATEAVIAAEKSLNDLRKVESDQIEKIQGMTEEYNGLVAAGADPAVLKQKRDAIKAEQDSLKAMDKERIAAEKNVSTMKEGLSPLQQQIEMQGNLVKQIQELVDTEKQAKQEAKAAAAAGGAAGAAAAAAGGAGKVVPKFDTKGLTDAFDVEGFKKQLDEKFKTAFAPVTEAWNNQIKPAIDEISKAWGEFAPKIGKAWDQWIQPALKWVVDNAGAVAGAFITWKITMGGLSLLFSGSILANIGTFVQNLGLIGNILKVGIPAAGPYLLLAAAITALVFVVIKYGPAAWKTLQMLGTIIGVWWQTKVVPAFQAGFQKIGQVWTMFTTWITGVWNGFLTTVSQIWAIIAKFFTDVWTGIKTKATEIWQGIKDGITDFITKTKDDIIAKMDELDPEWRAKWQAIKDAVVAKWTEIKDQISAKWEEIKTSVATAIETLRTNIEAKWVEIKTKAISIWNEIKTSIYNTVFNLWQDIMTRVEKLRDDVAKVWEDVKKAASTAWEDLKTAVSKSLTDLGDVLTDVWQDLVAIGTGIVDGIKEGISTAWTKFKQWLAKLLVNLINLGADAIDSGSPSRMTAKLIGKPFAQGIQVGIQEGMKGVRAALGKELMLTVNPTMNASQMRSAQQAQAAVAYNTNYNLQVMTNQSPAVVLQSYETMRALGGA